MTENTINAFIPKASILRDFLLEIETRLSVVPNLKYEIDLRQLQDDDVPICFMDVNSNKPVGSDVFPQYQKKCKSSFGFSLIVYSDSLVNLLDLIENIEQAMMLSENIKGSLKIEYGGFEIAVKEKGQKSIGALLSFSIEYIKEF